ncbi:mitochondrial inner membrane protease subunit 2-like [Amphiura filiformis]|uniref:mitochondrial inner membrane protease subunit 2-like n=1 Tax=Amphiura filiformis TaxID=82378 RepID=UPI003B226D07
MAATGSKVVKIFAGGFAVGAVASLTLFDNVGYLATVDGKSMQPVFNPSSSPSRDVVFLSRMGVRDGNIKRGDIVSLASPRQANETLIKRVIALEGDRIKTLTYKNRYLVVPEGHCWIEGDHNSVSLDSNVFGPVSLGLVHAKASHIVWPLRRVQRIQTQLPPGRGPIGGEGKEREEEEEEEQITLPMAV